jgi:hypothetical protein
MKYPFIGPAYTAKFRGVSYEQCINLYVETIQNETAKARSILVGTPGTLPSYPAYPNGGIPRGIYTMRSSGVVYAVAGNSLYKHSDDETATPIHIGDIVSNGRCRFADDGRYLSIADGQALYVLDTKTLNAPLVTPVTDVLPTHVVFLGGYTVINQTFLDPAQLFPPSTNLMFYSELYNATDWSSTNDPDALQFFAAEGNADPVIAMERVGNNIFAFGSASFEVYSESSNPNRPFARVGGSLNDIGCAAPNSTAVMGSSAFWIGTTAKGGLSIYKSNGYDAVRISDTAIEGMIRDIDFTSGIGWCYEDAGHKFYVLSFRDAKLTVVWDDSEGCWHTRSSRVAGTDNNLAWEPIYATSLGTTTYVASQFAPRLLKLSNTAYTEWDGRLIKRTRSGPVIWDGQKTVRHNMFVLDMQKGVGQVQPTDIGFDPQVMLRYSDDGGETWSPEDWRSFGLRADRQIQVRWNRLGISKERVYEVVITAPVPVTLVGVDVEITAGGRY